MQIEHTPRHTQLVTEYIALHDAWLQCIREGDDAHGAALLRIVQECERWEVARDAISTQFTAAHWEELHARRG